MDGSDSCNASVPGIFNFSIDSLKRLQNRSRRWAYEMVMLGVGPYRWSRNPLYTLGVCVCAMDILKQKKNPNF